MGFSIQPRPHEKMKKIIITTISLLLVFPPSTIWAAARTFKPRIAGFFGSMELNSHYEENESSSSSYSTQTKDTAFREILNVGTNGYVYHPNLVTFLLKASEALEQEKYETGSRGNWRNFTSESYEARAFVLPTHPYNLEVFSALSRPLIAGNLAGRGGNNGQQRHGAYFRYRKRPWSGSLNYNYGRSNGNAFTLKNNTSWADLTFNKYTYLHGNARFGDTKSSDGNSGENTQFTLDNQHTLNIFSLSSSWQQNTNRTGDKFGTTNNIRARKWGETLGTNIPALNLQHSVSYSLDRAKSDRLDLPSVTASKTFTNSESMNTGISHALYRSVYTNANLSHTITDSSGGKNTLTNARGNVGYRKQIYRGSFGASIWKSYNNLDRMGAMTLLQDQAYNTGVAGNPFTLSDRFVDENTIQIKIVDPNGILAEETLIRGIHYTVSTAVDTTRIDILPPLPGAFNFAQLNTYTLLLNYSFLNTTFEMDTNSQGFSLQLSLLDNLLNPHYSFTRSTQELVDGVLPGGVNNSEAHAAGLTVVKEPYLVGVEYSRSYASRNSEKRWYGVGEYRKELTEYTNLNARLEAERTTTYPGDNESTDENEEPERLYRVTLNCSTSLPKLFLNMHYGVYYSRRLWMVDTSIYAFYSNLNWKLGKVDLSLGANYSDSTSTTATGNTNESNTMVFYLNLKRKLF